jgi:hypothetical protein
MQSMRYLSGKDGRRAVYDGSGLPKIPARLQFPLWGFGPFPDATRSGPDTAPRPHSPPVRLHGLGPGAGWVRTGGFHADKYLAWSVFRGSIVALNGAASPRRDTS